MTNKTATTNYVHKSKLKKRQQTVIDERNSADTVGLIFNKGYKEHIMTVFTKIFLKMPVELTKKTKVS